MARLQTTQHAYERFRQRVLPLLSKNKRKDYSKFHKVNEVISSIGYGLMDGVNTGDKNIIKIETFVSLADELIVPIILVIDTVEMKIITLYVAENWEKITNGNKISWRCLC